MRLALKAAKLLFLAAALWSVGASAWLFFSPTIHTTQTAVIQAADGAPNSQTPVTTVERHSWFQSQGWWGVFVLLSFVGLYGGAAGLISSQRNLAGACLALLALLLTGLARLSIGPLYLPAAAAIIIGLAFLVIASQPLAKP